MSAPAVLSPPQAKIVSAWNSSAQAYIGAYQGGSTGQIPPGMDAGFKLAAKLVRAHSEKARLSYRALLRRVVVCSKLMDRWCREMFVRVAGNAAHVGKGPSEFRENV